MATKMNGKLPVVSFGKLSRPMPMPNLLDVQVKAFEALLQPDATAEDRRDVGLERVFNCAIEFEAQENELVFDADYLNQRIADHGDGILERNARVVERALSGA